jgi:Na+-translocating ferredoxin:NAD+ oxidoreductase RnfG subunit
LVIFFLLSILILGLFHNWHYLTVHLVNELEKDMIKRQHINQVNSQIMPVVKEAENEDREQEENDQ